MIGEALSRAPQRRTLASDDAVQDLFWREGWTDGLPIIPPTPERVEAVLRHARVAPETVVGTVDRVEITAENLAINAVMAGCKPEYFPVVRAAWECLLADEYNVATTSLSTSGGAPFFIVSGPIARRIGMRSGVNVLGPGNRANATVGRAMRLAEINLIGVTDALDCACFGHPGKYTFCIAEDEDDVWEPLRVQRGHAREDSTVTLLHTEGPQYVRDSASRTPEELLANVADHVRIWNQGGAGVLLFNPDHRRLLQEAGWSKVDVARYVFERSGRTLADLKGAARVPKDLRPSAKGSLRVYDNPLTITEVGADDATTIARRARSPEDFLVIGAGGYGTFSAVLPPGIVGSAGISIIITRAVATHQAEVPAGA